MRLKGAFNVKDMRMFVQPDGKVFFGNHEDGSHRLAAAILAGKPDVSAYTLQVSHLDHALI